MRIWVYANMYTHVCAYMRTHVYADLCMQGYMSICVCVAVFLSVNTEECAFRVACKCIHARMRDNIFSYNMQYMCMQIKN